MSTSHEHQNLSLESHDDNILDEQEREAQRLSIRESIKKK